MSVRRASEGEAPSGRTPAVGDPPGSEDSEAAAEGGHRQDALLPVLRASLQRAEGGGEQWTTNLGQVLMVPQCTQSYPHSVQA